MYGESPSPLPMLIGLAGRLALIGVPERIARAVSRSADGLALDEQLALEVPRQFANAHTINVVTLLLLLPFIDVLAALIVRIVRYSQTPPEPERVATALNPVRYEVPSLAMDAVRQELGALGRSRNWLPTPAWLQWTSSRPRTTSSRSVIWSKRNWFHVTNASVQRTPSQGSMSWRGSLRSPPP